MNKTIYIALALLLSACDGGGSSASNTQATTAAAPASEPIALKKVGKADGLEVTVAKVTTPKQIGPQGVGGKAEAGETYVVVEYTIKNTGKAALPFLEWPKFSLIDPSGRALPADDMMGAMSAATMADASGMASDLNPGVSAKARAAWKIGAAFDKATWKLVLASDPQLTFALK